MFFQSQNRFVAYSPAKEKITFRKTYNKIVFEDSPFNVEHSDTLEKSFAVPAAVIEQAVEMGFTFLQDELKKRLARFVYEYHHRGLNTRAGICRLPKITFASFIYPDNNKVEALRVKFEPLLMRGTDMFTYQLTGLLLNYSRAKTSNWSEVFDYTIELTLYILKGGALVGRTLPPIVIQSVVFGENDLSEWELYTSPIALEKDSTLVEVGMTIVESNPAQVNTSNVLKSLSDNKENIQKRLVELLGQLLNPE